MGILRRIEENEGKGDARLYAVRAVVHPRFGRCHCNPNEDGATNDNLMLSASPIVSRDTTPR